MVRRLWRLIRHGFVRARWPLAGLGAFLVALACVVVIPQWLVRWELGASMRTLTAAERAKAINDVRATFEASPRSRELAGDNDWAAVDDAAVPRR
jgi:hypothetical protein